MGLQVCECVDGAGWKFVGGGNFGKGKVALGVCDFLLLIKIVLVGVGDVRGSGGEVLSGLVVCVCFWPLVTDGLL